MRTTLIIRDDLMSVAQELCKEKEKTKVVHLALEALIEREAAKRLAKLGGTEKQLFVKKRRK